MTRPSLLDRYLFRQTNYLLLITLIIGSGVYLMSELFDRLDNFIEAGIGLKIVLIYFCFKLPFIIAQILPAAFLLSVIIQLCLMARNRELLALQAGGISLWRIVTFFLLFGLLWGSVQLFLSQNLGVWGNREAIRIWNEEIKGREQKASIIRNFWFLEGNMMVYTELLNLDTLKGQNLNSYSLSEDELNVEQVIRAPSFDIDGKTWNLHNATVHDTNGFVRQNNVEIPLKIKYSLRGLKVLGENYELQNYSLWQIGDAIKRLKKSGSNVEVLRTTWHGKLAYAASLMVMSLIALALITWKENIYINIALGLAATFIFYTMLSIGATLGESGRLSPILASWFPVFFTASLALLRIIWAVPPSILFARKKTMPTQTK